MGCDKLLAQHSAPSRVGHGPLGKWLSISECCLAAEVEGGPWDIWARGHPQAFRVFPYRFQIHHPSWADP